MITLPRRLLRDWLGITTASVAAAWVGATLLFHAIDAFENLRAYTQAGASTAELLTFFLLRTPEIAFQILPAALLIGTLIALFRIARQKEFTAAESAGMHPGWAYLAPAAIACLLAGAQILLELGPLPTSRELADRYQADRIERNPLRGPDPVRWRLAGPHLWRVETLSEGEKPPRRFRFERYHRTATGVSTDRWTATATTAQGWRSGAATRVTYPPLRVTAGVTAPALPFLPEELRPIRSGAAHLGLAEAVERVRRKHRLEAGVSRLELDLHQRLSWPFLNLTVLLAALPFVPRHGRRASAALGVLVALVIGILGWALLVVGSAVASSQRAPAGFWLPHAVLSLTGLAAWMRITIGRRRAARRFPPDTPAGKDTA